MRIILSAIICIMCPTIPATFQLAIDLHADKVTEVLLMGPVEQVSLVQQVLRARMVQQEGIAGEDGAAGKYCRQGWCSR